MYNHTQRSPLHILLYLPAVFMFFAAWLFRNDAPPSIVTAIIAGIFVLLALSFQRLTVTDEEDRLNVRYGPLNLFGTRIPYDEITKVETGKTSWIDGWGIHFIPFRGWTINLWGFECVKLTRGERVIRIGTDDSENLKEFLQSRITQESAA